MTRFLFRALNLIGLAVSSLLLVDYLQPSPVFCTADGGCSLVRESHWASVLGVPTPALGIAFNLVALILSLFAARRWLLFWTGAGAAAAVGFIYLQLFVIRAVCPYCMVADVSAILMFALALVDTREPRAAAGRTRGTMVALGVLAALLPFGLERVIAKPAPPPPAAAVEAPGLPAPVAREQKPGWVTIVEFVDFECPYCRRLHQEMVQALAGYDGPVRIVRKHNPLSGHENALPAARAACCAGEQGKEDAMADALYAAPAEEIDAPGCEKIAEKLGLDMDKYRSCIASRRPDERIAADQAEAEAAGIAGVAPVFWVGKQKFEGVRPAAVIRQALLAAAR